MPRKLNGISRTAFNNAKLEDCLKVFKDIVSCIEDIINEPDDGSGKTMTSICLKHNINYFNLRGLTQLAIFNNIYTDKVLTPDDIAIVEDPYETLYRMVFGLNKNDVIKFPVDLHESINYAIKTLRDHEHDVLRMRFGLDGEVSMTLEDVGKELNVSGNRIQQIEAKALRKLRHPNRAKIIRDGLIKYNEVNKIVELQLIEKRQASEKRIEEYKNNIKRMVNDDESILPIIEAECSKIDINELEFSVKTYNTLKRCGGKYDTLYNILLATNSDLMNIRNFGRMCLNEVEHIINKHLAVYGLNRRMFLEMNGLTIEGEKL